MAKFKKGSKVAVIRDWDGKGTVAIKRATVQVWGANSAKLIDDNGKMFKVAVHLHAHLHRELHLIRAAGGSLVTKDSSDANLAEIALDVASAVLECEKERLTRLINGLNTEAYKSIIKDTLAELHEPQVHWL